MRVIDRGMIALIVVAAAAAATAQPMTADLSVGQSASPDHAAPGQDVTYTVTTAGAAGPVTLTDVLPGNVTFVSATAAQGLCS